MPCRSRLGGLEVEGWGNVFIEAAACGRPVVVGDSGGAPRPSSTARRACSSTAPTSIGVADAVADLLADPSRADAMGAAGRARVERDHAWPGSPSAWRAGCARPSTERAGRSTGPDLGYPRFVSVVEERRCPNCHALVSADADWCGQCFTPLRPKSDTPETPPVPSARCA
jgi:ribosomal protein L40E